MANAQTGNPDSLIITEIRSNVTDPNIAIETYKHNIFYNPTATDYKTLLVHLPGSFDAPLNTQLFPSYAANWGFHAIGLRYKNSVAAKSACEDSEDPNCFANYRKEIIEGVDVSDKVDVDSDNSIENRLLKLIIHLHSENPNDGWGEFIANGELAWGKIIISGHSQGGGHAAYIGLSKPLKRILMFASPNDYSKHFDAPASWPSTTPTADISGYYAFGSLNDDIVPFDNQYQIWKSMGMNAKQDSTVVEGNVAPFKSSQMMYTTYSKSGTSVNHNATIRDEDTPLDENGKPVFENVWGTMLGIYNTSSVKSNSRISIPIYPNPANTEISIPIKWDKASLHSISGAKLLNWNTYSSSVSVATLPAGIYFLTVYIADKTAVVKVIME